jgi:hypothetical protein
MKRQLMRATAAQPLPDAGNDDTPAPAIAELDGVRRKPAPPASLPVPTAAPVN